MPELAYIIDAIRAAGILFVSQDNALFVRRIDTGEWSIPAGGIEADETAEGAAQREAAEEVGNPGINPQLIDERLTNGVEFSTYLSLVEQEFTPILNGEHDEFVWATLENPPQPLHPGLRATLDALFARYQHTDAYNPDEPRDPLGRWTESGGGDIPLSEAFSTVAHEIKDYFEQTKTKQTIEHFVKKQVHETVGGKTAEHAARNQLTGALKVGVAAVLGTALDHILGNPFAAWAISEATLEMIDHIKALALQTNMEGEELKGMMARIADRLHAEEMTPKVLEETLRHHGDANPRIAIALGQIAKILKGEPPVILKDAGPPDEPRDEHGRWTEGGGDADLINKAKEHFGLTYRLNEAGYIMPDGSMLDFSGRHYAQSDYKREGVRNVVLRPGERDWVAGQRNVDHRELFEILPTEEGVTIGSNTARMYTFMRRTGAIRTGVGGYQMLRPPTARQLRTIVAGHRQYFPDDPLRIDISGKTGEHLAHQEFTRPTIERVQHWIKLQTKPENTPFEDGGGQADSSYPLIGHQSENEPLANLTASTIADAAPRRRDPTRTQTLRRAFRAAAELQLRRIRALLRVAIVDHDMLGLSSEIMGFAAPAARLGAFNSWFEAMARVELAGVWVDEWVSKAIRAGEKRALGETQAETTGDWSKLDHLFERANSELKGIAAALSQQVGRLAAQVVGNTHVSHETSRRSRARATPIRPVAAFRFLVQPFDKIAKQRLRPFAHDATVRAFNHAKIAIYRANGVARVGINPELVRHRHRAHDGFADEEEGHPFRGNQYTSGQGGGSFNRGDRVVHQGEAGIVRNTIIRNDGRFYGVKLDNGQFRLVQAHELKLAAPPPAPAKLNEQQRMRAELNKLRKDFADQDEGEEEPVEWLPEGSLVGWLTAGDIFVCPTCEELAAGSPYSLEEAQALIPVHIECRCSVYPWSDLRFAGDAAAFEDFNLYHEPAGTPAGGQFASGGMIGSTEDFAKGGINVNVLPAHREQFIRTWNTKIHQTPEAFHKNFLGGVHSTMDISYNASANTVKVTGSVLNERSELPIGNYEYSISFGLNEAEFELLELNDKQTGHGIAKQVMAANVEAFKKMGLNNVRIHANIDVGAYAWARYGFVPTERSWDTELHGALIHRIQEAGSGSAVLPGVSNWSELAQVQQEQIMHQYYKQNPRGDWTKITPMARLMWAKRNAPEMIGATQRTRGSGEIGVADEERLLKLANSDDPKALWAIADSRWGKRLLLGQEIDWHGTLDLNDAESMTRFNDYISKKRMLH